MRVLGKRRPLQDLQTTDLVLVPTRLVHAPTMPRLTRVDPSPSSCLICAQPRPA
jgi:hypothetical protein